MTDDMPRVNPAYALGQLEAALRRGSAEQASDWVRVLKGLLGGDLEHGSRTPVPEAPPWVTLKVIHGGFATGELAAGGELAADERDLLHRLDLRTDIAGRAELNAYFLGDDGREELRRALRERTYRIAVAEEAALLVVTWLIDAGETSRAETVLEAIAPFMASLRFYPRLERAPFEVSDLWHRRSVGEVRDVLRACQPKAAVAAMNEAIRYWTPLYDRSVSLFLETVEGEPPLLVAADDRSGVRAVEGGWPCRTYPVGWADRARALLTEYADLREQHHLSGRPERPKENFARLRHGLAVAADDPDSLAPREVGMIRSILASFSARHGAPDSAKRRATREMQDRLAAAPMHHLIAHLLAARLDMLDPEDGLADAEPFLTPLTPSEASTIASEPGRPIPWSLDRTVRVSVGSTPEDLLRRGYIRSSESLARVSPALAAAARADAIDDELLSPLYFAAYGAFRRRRSLLLLDLVSQVRMRELPWITAIEPWVGTSDAEQAAALDAAQRVWRLNLLKFPHSIVPNALLRDLRALIGAAGKQIPLVEELAADIFMGDFSASYVRSGRYAAETLEGSLYARYYGVPYSRVLVMDDGARSDRPGASPAFAALCRELAGVADLDQRHSVAVSGAIIEQAQVITTHNIVQLTRGLGLGDEVAQESLDLAHSCFRSTCQRLAFPTPERHARLLNVKNAAYAWRQMVLYLTLADADADEFASWSRQWLKGRVTDVLQGQLEPAIAGLVRAAHSEVSGKAHSSDAVEPGRFLGWTTGSHWLVEPADS